MAVMPKPRSKPTIKPLATMNNRHLRNWEMRLGLLHILVIVGVVTGSMLAAYAFGYLTGQSVGYENALASAAANAARFPVAGTESDESFTAEQASDIYAKLGSATSGQHRASILPELGSIKTTADAPLDEELPAREAALASTSSEEGFDLDVERSKGFKSTRDRAQLKTGTPSSSAMTLGGLIEKDTPEKLTDDSSKTLEVKQKVIEKKKEEPALKRINSVDSEASKPREEERVEAVKKLTGRIGSDDPPSSGVKTALEETTQLARAGNVATPPTRNFIRAKIPGGWYAQVSAPRQMQDAQRLAGKLRGSGFPVMIERAQVRGQDYYRVIVGPEDSRQRAERMVGQLGREKYISGSPFIRMIR